MALKIFLALFVTAIFVVLGFYFCEKSLKSSSNKKLDISLASGGLFSITIGIGLCSLMLMDIIKYL